jgi:hypothetical protein
MHETLRKKEGCWIKTKCCIPDKFTL